MEYEPVIGYKQLKPNYKRKGEDYYKSLERKLGKSESTTQFIESCNGIEDFLELMSLSPKEVYEWLKHMDEEIKKRKDSALVN